MKIKLSLIIALLSVCSLAQAQIGEHRNDLAIGVSGGMAMNKISFTPTINQKYHIGKTFGLTLRYTCEKYFSAVCALQVELNYMELGWREEINDKYNNPLPDTYRRNLHYVQLPFMARLAWGKEHRGMMGYLVLGPQVGYCFKENSVRSNVWTLGNDGKPSRPNDRYEQYDMAIEKKFDYGITGGLGMELSTKIGHFLLEGRYYFGLGNIFNDSKKDLFERSANGAIVAKLTYLIDVNRKRNR